MPDTPPQVLAYLEEELARGRVFFGASREKLCTIAEIEACLAAHGKIWAPQPDDIDTQDL